MRSVLLILAIIVTVTAYSQDQSLKDVQGQSQRTIKIDTITKDWRKGGVIAVNIGQGGSRNWAAGAEKYSFSVASYLSLFANRQMGKYNWDNTLDLGFALVNTTSLGSRKTDDKIDLFTKFSRDLTTTVSLGLVGNLRTQFYDGYDYNYLGKGIRRRTSDFFAPAYAVIAPGVDWHPTKYFSVFLAPLSARFIIVTNEPKSYYYQGGVIPGTPQTFEVPLAVLYGVDPARQVRNEIGGFASVNFNRDIIKNVAFKTRLDLFSNYIKTYRFTPTGPDQLDIQEVKPKPQNVDVYWSNLLVMKVNKFLNVTYNFDLIYDDDVRQFGPSKSSAAAQMRTMLGVGFSAKF
ncbi:MAG TPA: DUF3078 domain-containing protein [Flavitalea sp.]|nr:DUF3078 domain-containing protein [Flavitalea sp.]